MKFTLHVEPAEQAYVLEHDEVICGRLQTTLLLLLQELHEQDRKHTTVIGKGISGDASIETANAQDEIKRWHEATFPNNAELSKQIQESVHVNTMVKQKG